MPNFPKEPTNSGVMDAHAKANQFGEREEWNQCRCTKVEDGLATWEMRIKGVMTFAPITLQVPVLAVFRDIGLKPYVGMEKEYSPRDRKFRSPVA